MVGGRTMAGCVGAAALVLALVGCGLGGRTTDVGPSTGPTGTAAPTASIGATAGRSISATPGPSASASATPSPSPSEDSLHFASDRWGFECSVPIGWPLRTEDTDDGVVATDPTGVATVRCTGSNVVEPQTPAEALADARRRLEEAGVTVSYRHTTRSTYAVSGTDAQGVVTYEWAALGARSRNEVAWTYPASMRDQLDPAVTTSVREFRTGDLSVPH